MCRIAPYHDAAMIDLPALRRLAQAATPGPWHWGSWMYRPNAPETKMYEFVKPGVDKLDEDLVLSTAPYGAIGNYDLREKHDLLMSISTGYGGETSIDISDQDANYIAALNPTVVLALLDRLEVAEQRRSNPTPVENEVALQQTGRCPTCGRHR